jgi:sugar O-acyltransferase (sialic acid O-acetyltransferase NeuD family)
LPVIDFAAIEHLYPPDEYAVLLPIGPVGMNAVRADRLAVARHMGYAVSRYVSTRALTWPELEVRDNVMIHDGAIVQPFATIGENTIVRSGAHLSHHVDVGADSFVSASACLGGNVIVQPRCFIGLNATIRDGITIARGCAIGAGAVVVEDTEPEGLYVGVPARRKGLALRNEADAHII